MWNPFPSLLLATLAFGAACERSRPTSESSGRRLPPFFFDAASAKASGGSVPPRVAPSRFEPKRTFALIVGVLSFQDPSVGSFATRNRKDQELHDVLIERGVPRSQVTLLLDKRATRAAILSSLDALLARAPQGSTFIFYYAGHGARMQDESRYFLAFDTRAAEPRSTGVVLEEISRRFNSGFRGNGALFMADCCYSGALSEVAAAARSAGIPAASLTSAEASNLSTVNWTFTQTVINGMRGNPLADRNRDGVLELAELSRDVAEAMKYREKQRSGFSSHGLSRAWKIGSTLASLAPEDDSKAGFGRGSYVNAPLARGYGVARVLRAGTQQSLVRFYHYSDSDDQQVATARLQPIRFSRFAVGADVKVYWGSKIWDAKVLEQDGDFHRVTYPGWSAAWNEWILSDRVVSLPNLAAGGGDRVLVEWHGQWYPAVVLEKSGERHLIHYEGYDSSWDEWVTPERVRKPGSAPPGSGKGEKVLVEWHGQWFPAIVLRKQGERRLVHYEGFDASWDEWVSPNRVRRPGSKLAPADTGVSSKVEVEWRGSWYPAVVLQREGRRALVHYEGYDASWDEWVLPGRIRPRRQ